MYPCQEKTDRHSKDMWDGGWDAQQVAEAAGIFYGKAGVAVVEEDAGFFRFLFQFTDLGDELFQLTVRIEVMIARFRRRVEPVPVAAMQAEIVGAGFSLREINTRRLKPSPTQFCTIYG